MSDLKVYVVTLKRHEDLEAFYEDMETPGGDLYIPDRKVDVKERRPLSRNTEYYLTDEEAAELRKDSRVQAVTLQKLGIVRPMYSQTDNNWDKAYVNINSHKNWGLLRVYEGQQRSNWGEDGTTNQSGTINIKAEGRNVDVIIVDGHFDPTHPEYAVNSDGTGGSRVIQYNWYQHNSFVSGGVHANGTYVYTPYVDNSNAERTSDNNHGAHVAGTVAGNTSGWARLANIYNISPYGATNPNTLIGSYLYDYIKAFHLNKPVNPITKRKNPTILNCSYGQSFTWNYTDSEGTIWGSIAAADYRGNYVENISGLSVAQMNNYGIYTTSEQPVIPYYNEGFQADIEDLLELGIIIVAASGNDAFFIASDNDADWDNKFYSNLDNGPYFYVPAHRGTAPASVPGVISVGAVGNTANETKAGFSNTGPGVDIFSPGRAIMSSLNSGGTTDPRNSSYRLGKYQGTSMASPQVCGLLACMLEIYPDMTPAQAKEYLIANAKIGQMTDTGNISRAWNVSASGTTNYSFSGYSAGSDISITVQAGAVLEFNVNAIGHPFWIKTTQTTGTANGVTTGVITNNGTDNGKVMWDTFGVLPGTYYYICQNHSSMTGTITITTGFSDTTNLNRAPNRYLYYKNERPDSADVFPKKNYFVRKTSGVVYPRTRLKRRA